VSTQSGGLDHHDDGERIKRKCTPNVHPETTEKKDGHYLSPQTKPWLLTRIFYNSLEIFIKLAILEDSAWVSKSLGLSFLTGVARGNFRPGWALVPGSDGP